MTTVLFLGLGHMGGPMAANLAAAGHRVLGFDLVPEALEKARAAGVETVTDTAAAAAEADVVLTMLPHGRLVLDVYRGEDGDGGLLAAARLDDHVVAELLQLLGGLDGGGDEGLAGLGLAGDADAHGGS